VGKTVHLVSEVGSEVPAKSARDQEIQEEDAVKQLMDVMKEMKAQIKANQKT